MSVMVKSGARAGDSIFRPEMLEYLQRRRFGEPLPVSQTPSWWTLLPIAAFAALLVPLAGLSSERRLPAHLVSLSGREVMLDAPAGVLQAGQEALVVAGGASLRFQVVRVALAALTAPSQERLVGRLLSPTRTPAQTSTPPTDVIVVMRSGVFTRDAVTGGAP